LGPVDQLVVRRHQVQVGQQHHPAAQLEIGFLKLYLRFKGVLGF
jgi:hypothetical protein